MEKVLEGLENNSKFPPVISSGVEKSQAPLSSRAQSRDLSMRLRLVEMTKGEHGRDDRERGIYYLILLYVLIFFSMASYHASEPGF